MRRWGVLAVALALLGLAPVVAPDARGDTRSGLPVVASGARPGPDVLYAGAPDEPILENHDPRFKADPILVMGQEAYVKGEYLYQDWIYDDNGADTGQSDAGGTDTAGDVEYPADPPDHPRYAGNAADIVELRVAPGAREVAYRFTLNTLLVPDSTVVTLALDGPETAAAGPIHESHGLGGIDADQVITTWGTGADVETSGPEVVTTEALPADAVHVDLEANQITVVVPRTLSDPQGTLQASLAAGVYDAATGYVQTSINPVAPTSPAYDLGLTFDEAPHGITPHDSKQAAHLKDNVLPRHPIDFDALRDRVDSTSVPLPAPDSGGVTLGRIYPSRIDLGEGKDYDDTPEIHGRLQPYSIYVPSTYDPEVPSPLMLDLHSLGEHHWQYNDSTGVQQIGEQRNAIVISCECRGEDGWYLNEAEYDVFEMWNDAARHYNLDPDHVGITGYSMGGYATYRLGGLYPDLFGKALSIVGPPTAGIWAPPTTIGNDETLSNIWLDNFRNLPIVNAAAGPDELVPVAGTRAQNLGAPEWNIRGFEQLGYRYRYVLYPTAEHLTIAVLGYDLPYQSDFLGNAAVDRNPYHVTFRYLPESDDPDLGLVHDHAYWVSGVKLASTDGNRATALVDAFSHAAGLGDPVANPQTQTPGQGPLPFLAFERTWGGAPSASVANTLTLNLTNVGEVTLDGVRAGLDPTKPVELELTASAPGTVHLVLGHRVVDVDVATGTATVNL